MSTIKPLGIYFLLYICNVVGMVNPALHHKRHISQDFEQSKKICIPKESLLLKSNLLAQIFSARVTANRWHETGYADISEYDAMLVMYTMYGAYFANDQGVHAEVIKRVASSDLHHCLMRFLVANNTLEEKQKQNFLDRCFLYSFKSRAFENAEFLLKNGASAHIALPKFDDDTQSVPYYGVSQLAYNGDFNKLRLLLRFGASANIVHFDENPLVNALNGTSQLQARTINTLLYYGADPKLKLKRYSKKRKSGATPLEFARNLCTLHPRSKILAQCYKLCGEGHAHRVYRMAHYLHRITALPTDICFIIAEYLYGRKLDKADQALLSRFIFSDYKIDRNIIK